MTTIGFDRHKKDTFIEHGADEAGLFVKLRTGVRGMTAEQAQTVPVVAVLRFAQPADLLDFADTCLDLAADGYRAMGENNLADGTDALRTQWPLANTAKCSELPARWQCAKGCGDLPDHPQGSGPYLMGGECSECGSAALPVSSCP